MKILSVPALFHDTSLCVLEDGMIVLYRMEERFSREKHDYRVKNIIHEILKKENNFFDRIVLSKIILSEKIYPLKKIENVVKIFKYDKLFFDIHHHHLYHAFCGFYNSNFDEAICISVDGHGAVRSDILENIKCAEGESVYYLNKKNPSQNKELLKQFRLFEKDGKKYTHNQNIEEEYLNVIDKITKVTNDLSVGEKYFKISEKYNYNMMDGAGKIMGLGQYKNHKEKLQYPYNTNEWKERVDEAYNLQQETQNHVLSLIQKYTGKTGIKNVVISGGYGLNCVANYHYLKNLKDINLYVDPICFDAGISIGAAYYHYLLSLPTQLSDNVFIGHQKYFYLQSKENLPPISPLKNVYLGHQEDNYDLTNLKTQKVSYNDIVDILLDQKVVALFQGKSESGQRALGNRSLLFDPRVSNGKDIVNQIKKRENFRPFAGTILLEEAHKWFNMLSLKESPYMQYAIDAYENAIEQVPAIIHADNTCRIQTVTQEQNKHFYNLISCFFEETGVPMLLNTSFNLGGEPLVETFEHAIYTLKNSLIEYLYLPEIETLVTFKNKKLIYQ